MTEQRQLALQERKELNSRRDTLPALVILRGPLAGTCLAGGLEEHDRHERQLERFKALAGNDPELVALWRDEVDWYRGHLRWREAKCRLATAEPVAEDTPIEQLVVCEPPRQVGRVKAAFGGYGDLPASREAFADALATGRVIRFKFTRTRKSHAPDAASLRSRPRERRARSDSAAAHGPPGRQPDDDRPHLTCRVCGDPLERGKRGPAPTVHDRCRKREKRQQERDAATPSAFDELMLESERMGIVERCSTSPRGWRLTEQADRLFGLALRWFNDETREGLIPA